MNAANPSPFRVHVGYTPTGRARFRRFADLDSAKGYCQAVFAKSGRILSITQDAPPLARPLLSVTSPLYLKRLARELNGLEAGFYFPHGNLNARANRARVQRGELQVRTIGNRRFLTVPSETPFHDCNGRDVCASRKT